MICDPLRQCVFNYTVCLHIETRIRNNMFCVMDIETRIRDSMFCVIDIETRIRDSMFCVMYKDKDT